MLGLTISHYRIVGKLGEDEIGVGYKSRDAHLHRSVALKVLPPAKVRSEFNGASYGDPTGAGRPAGGFRGIDRTDSQALCQGRPCAGIAVLGSPGNGK